VAQFNADINLNVQVDKALAGVRKIEQRIASIQNKTIEFKVERQRDVSNEIDRLSGSFKRLGSIVKGLTAAGGLGTLAVILRDLQSVRGIGGAVSTALGPIQGLTNALGSFTESAVQAASASPGLAAGLTAVSVAAIAFAPQIARATEDTLKLAKAGAQAGVPIKNLLNLLGAASNTLGQDSFGDASRFVEQYRKTLFETSESVSNLQRRQNSLQKTLNTYNSSSEVAVRIAGKLVDVQARLNEELREQADLLRRASGVNVTELEASKGRNSIETRKRADAFRTQQAAEQEAVYRSIAQLNERDRTALQEKLNIQRNITNEATLEAQRRKEIEERASTGLSRRIPTPYRTAGSMGFPVALPEIQQDRRIREREQERASAERALNLQKSNSLLTQGVTGLKAQIAVAEQLNGVYDAIVRSLERANERQSQLYRARANRAQRQEQGGENLQRLERINKLATNNVLQEQLRNKVALAGNAIRVNDFNTAKKLGVEIDSLLTAEEKRIDVARRVLAFRQKERKAAKDAAAQSSKERGKFAENLALGAGFPLLFGAGAGSVAGSIAGSFVGTGFGGQILGGAVGQILDDFSSKLKDVATSLSKPKEALEALEEAGLKVDDSIRQQVDSLLEAGKSYEAQQLVLQQITETLGPDAVSQLAAYDQETKKLEKSYQQAYSALVRELLPAMVGFVGLLNAVAGAFGNMPDWVKNIITGASYSGPFGISRVQFDALQNAGRDRSEGVQPTAPEQSPEFQKRQKELQQAAKQREIALRGQSEELQAQLDLLNSGLDITTDKGFELAKQVVIVKYLAELEEINNSKLEDGEKILKRQVALLQQKIGIANLESQRNRALQSAQSRAASAAASAAREAEARQKQVYAARISEINVLKDRFDYSVRNTQFEKGELAALEQRGKQLALERDGQLEILDIKYKQSAANAKSAEEATILYSVYRDQYQLLIDQYNLENKLNEQRKRALQTELAITALQRKQQAINTRRELEQERDRLALPTGNFIADAFNQQKLEQAFRYENTLRNINDQITELEERQKGADVDLFNTLGEQIKGLKEQRSIFQTLIPEIAAAEKQQLAYNQALGLIQGPVSSLVGGLREVAAGTKSVEQAFADFLNGLAEQLAQTAAQMIAQYIAIGIARKFAGLDSGFNFAGGSADAGASAANLLGGFGPIPRFANGGNPPVNKPSIVGERGPELFVPGTRGTIIPNDAMGGEVNSVVNINISDSGTSVDAKNAGKLGRMIESSTMAILTRERRPGGLLTR
jgi:uncharacterized membrane protein